MYRFAGNFHRLENDLSAAAMFLGASVRLQEQLLEQFPESPEHWDTLAATVRDEASLLALKGELLQASAGYNRRLEIVRKLQQADKAEPAFKRSLATALFDRASILYSRNLRRNPESAQKAADLFGELLELPASKTHPYDPLLRPAALNRVAMIEREEGGARASAGAPTMSRSNFCKEWWINPRRR